MSNHENNFIFHHLFIRFHFSQKTNKRDYEDINARLDRFTRKRGRKRVLNVNLEGKTFVLIQNKGTLVYKYVVSF